MWITMLKQTGKRKLPVLVQEELHPKKIFWMFVLSIWLSPGGFLTLFVVFNRVWTGVPLKKQTFYLAFIDERRDAAVCLLGTTRKKEEKKNIRGKGWKYHWTCNSMGVQIPSKLAWADGSSILCRRSDTRSWKEIWGSWKENRYRKMRRGKRRETMKNRTSHLLHHTLPCLVSSSMCIWRHPSFSFPCDFCRLCPLLFYLRPPLFSFSMFSKWSPKTRLLLEYSRSNKLHPLTVKVCTKNSR